MQRIGQRQDLAQTSKQKKFIEESLNSMHKSLESLLMDAESILIFLQARKLKESENTLKCFEKEIHFFSDRLMQLDSVLELSHGKNFFKHPLIDDLKMALLASITSLKYEKKRTNLMKLCNLFEYEILHNLNQWKKAIEHVLSTHIQ